MMALLHVHGNVSQARIARALGVHENTVRSAVKLYREKGDIGFYAPSGVRGASVMTPEVLEECRQLLHDGYSRSETAEAVGVKKSNIDKAVQKGQLPSSKRNNVKKKC
jgi:transposase-like protein